MGKMFPSRLPDEIINDRRRAAECRVYDALERQLGTEFHIFYSSPWLGTRPDGSEIDGEADFVVAHPDYGILFIEVKGGRISIDREGQWRSTDRAGITYKIKNPVEQAKKSKYNLFKKLEASPLWKKRWVCLRHGVILPDVSRDHRDLRPDMPLELFAFDDDMNSLEAWVLKRLKAPEEQDTNQVQPLGADGIYALNDLITRPIQLHVKLVTEIDQDLRKIKLLTEDQIGLLRDLEQNKRMAISGAAGTGKTVLAAEKARLLGEQGLKPLVLCFNAPLGLVLRKTFKAYPNVTATNIHQFCYQILRDTSTLKGDELQNYLYMGDDMLSNLLVQAFVDSNHDEYEAIIVDEGQDFAESWFKALEVLVKDGSSGILYVFYDDNQNVMSKSENYIQSLPAFRYHLSRNFRNTRKIFKMADNFYRGDFVRPIGPEGNEIQWHVVDGVSQTRDLIGKRIGDLVRNQAVSPQDVAVLVDDQKMVRALAPDLRLGQYLVHEAGENVEGQITLDSIRRFKGLEAPVVLLVLSPDMIDEYELLYTGMTRAQTILDVIGPEKIIRRISSICNERN